MAGMRGFSNHEFKNLYFTRDFLFCHELISFCRELTLFSRELQFCFAVAVNFILPWLSSLSL
jgi:hypothetical protein